VPGEPGRAGKPELSMTITDIRSGLLDDAPSKKKTSKRVRKDDKAATQVEM